ncbi:2-polyprenyl-6-methoxyphenol hydroxylase-like FAD-dependent oxidoreductase [Nocardia tenerifensis]|uniref:2-polyprenyl-6-methoxyphenol hydroxylase-like FAD-dependent oxidoreductase n=1 Tax=Nocardia tenerifensis TaxID=228006 RepID=A0A318JWM4_9NOCA|nr:FAD-dependent oxidoreductase [Nocardia tenerifensis]PXX57869.1 2-polyprenyl-6-methoxyphenol hydroxylase-like FAD-dependent oxidoreductase [Nocardia tenerifensis]
MEQTTCLVVGGGPAGMILGLLLARAGVEVTVLEKHKDFLRDFRGDTVHPTTLDLLDELGLGEEFAKLPARKLEQVQLATANGLQTFASLKDLPGKHKYIAMVPQWDLLDLLARSAEAEPSFHLRMNTQATELLWSEGKVTGVAYRTVDGGTGEIRADLTVACDGRGSVLRSAAGLATRSWPTPMDVWWFRLPRNETDPAGAVPVVTAHRAAVLLDRGDYWQCATLIAKGTDEVARRGPVDEIMRTMADSVSWLRDRVDALADWDEVKLLDVQLDRLTTWYTDGLLCIGDAAHAMSPVGGVGINLAVQDAVAAARILSAPLLSKSVSTRDLAKVQRRRTLPTVVTQGMQRLLHARVIRPALAGGINIAGSPDAPLGVRVYRRIPVVRSIPPFLVARGILPEHAPDFARRGGTA